MRTRQTRLSPRVAFALAVLCLFTLAWGGVPTLAQAQGGSDYKALMAKGKQEYGQKNYNAALGSFQKALRKLRGKPLYTKVPAYLYIGMCLYVSDQQGLAWKAFEQALFQNASASLPASKTAEMDAFFGRVRARVLRRGGNSLGRSSTTAAAANPGGGTPAATGTPSPWPWVAMGVGAAGLGMGVALILNASGNSAELDSWVRSSISQGAEQGRINRAAQPLRDSISSRNTVGIATLIVGGVALAGGVVLLFVLPRPAATTTAHKAPKAPPTIQRAQVLLVQ